MTRYDLAVEIRAAASAVIRRIGRIERLGGKTPTRVQCAELGSLSIMHTGRFNPLPALPDHLRYQCAMYGKRIAPYILDIRVPDRKMFSVCWDDTDPRMDIVTFVKGDWYEALLQEPVG